MRLFVALDLPEDLRDELQDMAHGLPGARWISPENLHITLRFVGEVDGALADDVHEALSDIRAPGFSVQLAGLGCFGDKQRSRSLWVDVERNEALTHLQKKVESALVRAGCSAESRKFKPHVTIARLKNVPEAKLHAYLQRNALYRSEPFFADHFTLYQSFLGSNGAVYRPEADYDLIRRAA